jgi:hypothetical protein
MIFISYLDPASGAAFIQAIIAAIATSMVFLKLYWHKVLSYIKPSKNKKIEEGNDPK